MVSSVLAVLVGLWTDMITDKDNPVRFLTTRLKSALAEYLPAAQVSLATSCSDKCLVVWPYSPSKFGSLQTVSIATICLMFRSQGR